MTDAVHLPVVETIDTVAGRALLERMWLIRAFEEKASELYARGQIKGLLHLDRKSVV